MELLELVKKIERRFNESEFRDLLFRLNVDFDDLSGTTRKDKVRELVQYCDRLDRTEELIRYCKELRPKESWSLNRSSPPIKSAVNHLWVFVTVIVGFSIIVLLFVFALLLESPLTGTPTTGTPTTDTPATDTPATDTPATDTPATNTPAIDTLLIDEGSPFNLVSAPSPEGRLTDSKPIHIPSCNCTVSVVAGDNAIIRLRWGAKSQELAEMGADFVDYSLFIDDEEIPHLNSYRRSAVYDSSPIKGYENESPKIWWVFWDFPIGPVHQEIEIYVTLRTLSAVDTGFNVVPADQTVEFYSSIAVIHASGVSPSQSICGSVEALEFLQDDAQVGTNSGRWRLVLTKGSSACWYKVTHAGILSGVQVDAAFGVGPFRGGIEPHADFPCGTMAFDVWANVDGWEPSDWTMIGGPFLILPSFCE